jgi:hypothetical protein
MRLEQYLPCPRAFLKSSVAAFQGAPLWRGVGRHPHFPGVDGEEGNYRKAMCQTPKRLDAILLTQYNTLQSTEWARMALEYQNIRSVSFRLRAERPFIARLEKDGFRVIK